VRNNAVAKPTDQHYYDYDYDYDYYCYYYLPQLNEVNGGDNAFVRCVSVCRFVCVCAVDRWELNAMAQKRLELRT